MSDEKLEEMMSQASIKLTVKEAADRVLIVLGLMSGGDPQIAIPVTALMAECKRAGILRMSQSEFNNYAEQMMRAADARQN